MKKAAAVLAAAFSTALCAHAAPPTSIRYTVDIGSPDDRRLHVSMDCSGVRGTPFEVALPAWSPGWYVLNEADKRIVDVAARSMDGAPLVAMSASRRRWRIEPAGADRVVVEWSVLATDTGSGFFDPAESADHAFVPGPTTLLHAVGATEVPCRIRYKTPDGWRIVTGNDPVPGTSDTFEAPNYDTLADHPADLGRLQRWDRSVAGVPVTVVAVGPAASLAGPFARRCFDLVDAAARIFGSVPFPRYVFHLRYSDTRGFLGGLEHANASVIRMPVRSAARVDFDDLRLAAHELTHAWIVKRIRPAVLGPFDYSGPVRTPDLWFLEGVTDYFSPRIVVAAGLAGEDLWRGYVGRQVSEYLSNPARENISLETASLKVWEDGTSQGYGGLSYYNKGFLAGWWLDTELRKRTEGARGIEALVPALLAQCRERGYAPGAIERAANAIAGADLGAEWNRWLRSTEPLDFDTVAKDGGWDLVLVGGGLDTGIVWDEADAGPDRQRVANVVPGGPADRAGLRAGDIVVGIADAANRFRGALRGDRLPLEFLRGGQPRTTALTLTAQARTEARLSRRPGTSTQTQRRRDQITGMADRAAP
ncbi:MAG: PDZ domain-containing protein [Armatimonadota bacterium]